MLAIPLLDKWVRFNDVLLGEAINHPDFENRKRVRTNKIIDGNKLEGWIRCVEDEEWQLGEPGKLEMYVDPVTRKFF